MLYDVCLSLSDLLGVKVHPCGCKWHYFSLFYACVAFYCIYISPSSLSIHLSMDTSVVSMSWLLCKFVCFIFEVARTSNTLWYLSLSDLTSVSTVISGSISVTVDVTGRGTAYRAPERALVWHSAMPCPRRRASWQSKRRYWEGGTQVASRRVTELWKTSLPSWLTVLCFMLMGLASGVSLSNHSNSGSFLVAHASLRQGGF